MEKIVQNINVDLKNEENAKIEGRIKSIDRFRGFCVFAMLIFQFLKNFPSLGFLSRLASHSLETGIVILPGMTLADIIAPSFIFAIGLTYVLAFTKYKKLHGRKMAYLRYAARALSIIGLGGFLATCNTILDSFSGAGFDGVDITFIVFSSIFLACLVFKLITLIPKLKNIRGISTWVLYASLSLVGVLNLIVAGIDFFTLVGNINAQVYGYWVTLQNIGMACLIALPLVECKNWIRLIVAGGIFVLYTIFHQLGNNQALLDVVVHGGFLGGFGWGAMLIFDIFLADTFIKNKALFLSFTALFFAVGVWSTFFFGNINLGSCSPAFILTSVGLSGLLFYLFHLTDKLPHFKFDPLIWWGKNPIIMFLVEFFVIGVFTELAPASMLGNAPWYIAAIEGVIAVVALTAFCYLLNRKKKSISL